MEALFSSILESGFLYTLKAVADHEKLMPMLISIDIYHSRCWDGLLESIYLLKNADN